MCTIGRTTVKAAGEAHHRPDAEECTVRREQGRTDCGSKRGRNSFLSTAFIPLAQNNLTVDCYDSGECNSINVITRDNYEFLRDSYFRYSLLLQKEGVHMPGNSIGEGIANLYDEMNTLVGDELHVNIEQAFLPAVEIPQVGKFHAVLLPGEVSGIAQSHFKEDCHYLYP